MYNEGIKGVDYVVCNTDAQAPTNGWQALHRLATDLAHACRTGQLAMPADATATPASAAQ